MTKDDVPEILAKWMKHNSKWFKDHGVSWDDAICHSFLTRDELLKDIENLKDEVKKGHLILLVEKKK